MPNVDLLPFFQGIYGPPQPDVERYMCIAYLRQGHTMIEKYFRWLDNVQAAFGLIDRLTADGDADIYYCVSLLTKRRRTRDFIDTTHCVWSDLDGTPATKLHLQPTYLIETSPGKLQAVWTLGEAVPYAQAEEYSRRIYQAHRMAGADSTWDATRLLRVPGTFNLKYEIMGQGHPMTRLVSSEALVFDPPELEEAYPISAAAHEAQRSATFDTERIAMVGEPEEILQRYAHLLESETKALYFDFPDEDDDWSTRLWRLEMDCFEVGMDIDEVFVVATQAGCNKYARDGRVDADLWKEVCRARASHERHLGVALTTEQIEEIDLLTPDEMDEVERQEPAWIERYQDWAATRTDAPPEFHTGGALMALSAVLSDKMVIPAGYGDVRPNLWVMLLANSTIARKTTSMNLAKMILADAEIDTLLATDGSMEGIITALSQREGQPSMFLRDEFSSFIAGAKKKDYMSGFLQDFCGLYDGTQIRRQLRKETIQTKDPIFLLFAGGVETKLLEMLGHEDISSGFIPRFITILGRQEIADLDLIGPPKPRSVVNKDTISAELRDILARYTLPPASIRVAGQTVADLKPKVRVEMPPEAWKRLQDAQRSLLELADGHESADLLLPCTERLVTNVLKVTALISASRQREVSADGSMRAEYHDLMLALYYARGWLEHLLSVVARVGRDPFDTLTYRILDTITKAGQGGMTRGAIMRSWRLSAGEATEVLKTLLDREEIIQDGGAGATSRGAVFRAGEYARTGKQMRLTYQNRSRRTATRS